MSYLIQKQKISYFIKKWYFWQWKKYYFKLCETVQSHLHHPEITANEYAKIPDIIKQKLHIYHSKQDKNYKLVLKNIGKKDENFAISLTWLSSKFKELKKEIKG